MDTEDLKRRLNDTIDQWAKGQDQHRVTGEGEVEFVKPPRTDGKRAVRTKGTGDRVFLIDDNEKTKAWITSPEILASLGFEMSDVVDLEDSELIDYKLSPSVYRVG